MIKCFDTATQQQQNKIFPNSLVQNLQKKLSIKCSAGFSNVFKLLHYCSINPVVRILYSHVKRKLSNGQLRKIWKETALTELRSFFVS